MTDTWIDRAAEEINEYYVGGWNHVKDIAAVIAKHAPDIPEVDSLLKLNNQVEEKSARRRDLLGWLFLQVERAGVMHPEDKEKILEALK